MRGELITLTEREGMRVVKLDTLVRAGQPPWRPVPAAEDIDVWDKYEFPICGSYRLDGRLIIFTLINTAGTRSLWAYVPVDREAARTRFLPRAPRGTSSGALPSTWSCKGA